LTLEDAVQRVYDRIGIKGRAIVWPHAEPCMDVDKPSQLELLRADLAKQQQQKLATRTRSASKKAVKPARAAKPKTAARAVKTKKPATLKTSRAKVKAEE
jgi:hypothetical protein